MSRCFVILITMMAVSSCGKPSRQSGAPLPSGHASAERSESASSKSNLVPSVAPPNPGLPFLGPDCGRTTSRDFQALEIDASLARLKEVLIQDDEILTGTLNIDLHSLKGLPPARIPTLLRRDNRGSLAPDCSFTPEGWLEVRQEVELNRSRAGLWSIYQHIPGYRLEKSGTFAAGTPRLIVFEEGSILGAAYSSKEYAIDLAPPSFAARGDGSLGATMQIWSDLRECAADCLIALQGATLRNDPGSDESHWVLDFAEPTCLFINTRPIITAVDIHLSASSTWCWLQSVSILDAEQHLVRHIELSEDHQGWRHIRSTWLDAVGAVFQYEEIAFKQREAPPGGVPVTSIREAVEELDRRGFHEVKH